MAQYIAQNRKKYFYDLFKPVKVNMLAAVVAGYNRYFVLNRLHVPDVSGSFLLNKNAMTRKDKNDRDAVDGVRYKIYRRFIKEIYDTNLVLHSRFQFKGMRPDQIKKLLIAFQDLGVLPEPDFVPKLT